MTEIADILARARGLAPAAPAPQAPQAPAAYAPPPAPVYTPTTVQPPAPVYTPPPVQPTEQISAVPSLDALDDREVRDFGEKEPLIPWIALVGDFTLDRVSHVGCRNGKAAYRFACTCLTSSDAAVIPGGQYTFLFDYLVAPRTDQEKKKTSAQLANANALVAAALKQNPKDPAYHASKIMGDLLAVCAASPEPLRLPFHDQQGPVLLKSGKTVTRYTFTPVSAPAV